VTANDYEVAKVLLDVVDALDYAWSTFKLLHLDLKPSNVLVENSSPLSVKVSDWGISRLSIDRRRMKGLTDEVPNNHKTAYDAGTPLFMAPERFSGNRALSPSVDIYSIGMMAVQLSTGLLPFRFGQVNPAEEIATGSYFQNALERLRDRSERFQRLCLQCIHPNASERPAAFRELAPVLKALIKK
jgi:serine/threonine protein kinase